MRVYTPDELRRFLEGVDAALRSKAEVVELSLFSVKRQSGQTERAVS